MKGGKKNWLLTDVVGEQTNKQEWNMPSRVRHLSNEKKRLFHTHTHNQHHRKAKKINTFPFDEIVFTNGWIVHFKSNQPCVCKVSKYSECIFCIQYITIHSFIFYIAKQTIYLQVIFLCCLTKSIVFFQKCQFHFHTHT